MIMMAMMTIMINMKVMIVLTDMLENYDRDDDDEVANLDIFGSFSLFRHASISSSHVVWREGLNLKVYFPKVYVPKVYFP